ncbi:type VII secretion protein EccE [Streptomyces sp. RFCAC02]|uniref:type VII secretion protein EccE n=1 Tax=Streptomyces sp. RFCAC02 TaxID=2499143 RepID=UPI001F103571|nr:type VII secretion protein EccE [Streptomyces sp. RFCAC02]
MRPVPRTGAGRLGFLWPLVCLQAAAGLAVGGRAADGPVRWVLLGLVILPVALAVLAVVAWWQGITPSGWLGEVLAFRRRRRRAAGLVPEGGDPLFALAAECRPGLRSHPFVARGGCDGREQREMGMVGDGGSLTVVLRVEAAQRPLQPGWGGGGLPLGLLRDALDTDGIRLAAVQAVQHTQPAPSPMLPERSVAATSYGMLGAQGLGGAPALRLTWVALRLDPELCPGAVAERGGGAMGAQRCLARAADQLASRLSGAGFAATVLSESELLSALAACAGSDPAVTTVIGQREGTRPRRTGEQVTTWRCDNRWHTTFRVTRWPVLGPGHVPLAGLVAAVTAVPAFATTFSLTLGAVGRSSVEMSGHIRVAGLGEGQARAAGRALTGTAAAAGLGVARMDRRQAPGLWATLPLGGAC